jgi:hypothetical protein
MERSSEGHSLESASISRSWRSASGRRRRRHARWLVVLRKGSQAAKMRVAVVGTGVSGLAAAHELARSGARVTVYEKEDCLGGHARTVDVEDAAAGTVHLDLDRGGGSSAPSHHRRRKHGLGGSSARGHRRRREHGLRELRPRPPPRARRKGPRAQPPLLP